MSHLSRDDGKLRARIRRIAGQVAAIERSLDEHADCEAILQQVAATRGAMNGLLLQLLETHLREHAGVDAPAEGVDPVMAILRTYVK